MDHSRAFLAIVAPCSFSPIYVKDKRLRENLTTLYMRERDRKERDLWDMEREPITKI